MRASAFFPDLLRTFPFDGNSRSIQYQNFQVNLQSHHISSLTMVFFRVRLP